MRERRADPQEMRAPEIARRGGLPRDLADLPGPLQRIAPDVSLNRIEQAEQNRQLDQHREAARQRVDAVLLVERHRRGLQFLRFAFVFRLQRLQQRLHFLHLGHRLELLLRERKERQAHDQRQQQHVEPVGRYDGMNRVEQAQHRVGNRLEEIKGEHGARNLSRAVAGAQREARTIPLRDGVEAAGMPGRAPNDAPNREKYPAERAMFLDGLGRVLRTGGHESAGRRKYRREQALVRRDERDQDPGHGKNRPSSAATAAKSASPDPGRAIRTTSRCGGRPKLLRSRKALTRRRSRLRTTAFPTALDTVMPMRDPACAAAATKTKRGPTCRLPRRWTRAKSLRRRSD